MSTPNPRDSYEVRIEIEKLRAIRGRLVTSVFGDNNNAALDAQLRVLEEGLNEIGVYKLFDTDDHEPNELEAALEAAYWLEGGETKLYEEWEPLVRK